MKEVFKGLNCHSDKCQYVRSCAQHHSAGDFRSEDGFTPKLIIEDDQVVGCESILLPSDGDKHRPSPVGYRSLGMIIKRAGRYFIYDLPDDREYNKDEV